MTDRIRKSDKGSQTGLTISDQNPQTSETKALGNVKQESRLFSDESQLRWRLEDSPDFRALSAVFYAEECKLKEESITVRKCVLY